MPQCAGGCVAWSNEADQKVTQLVFREWLFQQRHRLVSASLSVRIARHETKWDVFCREYVRNLHTVPFFINPNVDQRAIEILFANFGEGGR